MRAYILPYRVLFHDTMAYGTHHFMTNLKFQCLVREHLFFGRMVDEAEQGSALHEGSIVLTREAYSLNLGPVAVGERVAILLTVEATNSFSVRFCFRVVHESGRPVAAGYQVLVALDKVSQQLIPAPAWLRQMGTLVEEPLRAPDFSGRVHAGQVGELFGAATLELARRALADPRPPRDGEFYEVGGAVGLVASGANSAIAGVNSVTAGVNSAIAGANSVTAGAATARSGAGTASHRASAATQAVSTATAGAATATSGAATATPAVGTATARAATATPAASTATPTASTATAGAATATPAANTATQAANTATPVAATASVLQPQQPLERVFLFPGQGTYDPRGLIAALHGEGAELIREADAIGRELLGASVLTALESEAQHEATLRQHPDLGQLGIYLLGVLAAQQAALPPSLVLGHSLGEVAAMTVAGLLSPLDGARVVCHRTRALRTLGPGVGGMLALIGPLEKCRALLSSLGNIEAREAVVNHAQQCVIAGRFSALEQVEQAAARVGLSTRRLRSPQPFHSPLLAGAVEPFRAAIATIPFHPPKIPIYSPIEGRLLGDEPQMASLLASHFVRPLRFDAALVWLGQQRPRALYECGGLPVLGAFVRQVLGPDPIVLPARQLTAPPAPAAPLPEPIAIVSMGCVLPNAADPEQLWHALVEGRSGVADAAKLSPALAEDFLAQPEDRAGAPVPDKTYTLLGGFIQGFEAHASAILPLAQRESWSAAQRYLAEALCQALSTLGAELGHTRLILGSTADGFLEQDEALVRDAVLNEARRLQQPPEAIAALEARLCALLGARTAEELAPFPEISAVSRALLGDEAQVLAVDAACASSLYAIDLGVRALREGACELALCGGVFAPGPANSCLFSQFRGLSSTGSRPFDAAADGVVFGDGAAVLALRRLSDARARGERVLAVIREVGVSSDGRGPSVALPKRQGQALAMRRAWQRAGLSPESADYLEAHATSTPVGDSVEFSAIREGFGSKRARPLVLGSLKALTGHTGWAAGAASVMKVALAMEARTLPAQANYQSPNPGIDLGDSFVVPVNAAPWPNTPGRPRRAGVNGFGFGGSNAHLILEEPSDGLEASSPEPARRQRLAVVGVGASLPEALRGGEARALSDEALKLPKGRPMLPDIVDDMDRSQRLAIRVAGAALPTGWERLRQDIGVVLGLEGKTERSIGINARLYRDRLSRVLGAEEGPIAELLPALLARLDAIQISGPYTLPGLMPNVAAGRVSNFFDLMGPNLVIDAGPDSTWRALELAGSYLRDGVCAMVVAGGLSGTCAEELARETGDLTELGVVLALMEPERARAEGFEILAEIELSHAPASESTAQPARELGLDLRGARGALSLFEALEGARGPGHRARVGWPAGSLNVLPPGAPTSEDEDPVRPPLLRAERARTALPELTVEPVARAGLRLLVLAEGAPSAALADALDGATLRWMSPDEGPEGARVDLTSDSSARATVDTLNPADFDGVVVLMRAADRPELAARDPLAELLFVVARHLWPEMSRLRLGAICLSALDPEGHPHPATGPVVGLLKALQRELPELGSVAVLTDSDDASEGVNRLLGEWAHREGPVEVQVLAGQRGTSSPRELLALSAPGPALLAPGDVVVATGGARGVTAVLVEALQVRFGARLLLLGRSRPEGLDEALIALDDDAFAARETRYYREERAREPGVAIPTLRARFAHIAAARESARTLRRLANLPGEVRFESADLRDPAQVLQALRRGLEGWGPARLVLHGAGVQVSGGITRKSLEDFRGVLSTKVGGLAAVLDGLHTLGSEPRVHVLSSVFSFLGNDGQHGYGAANEQLDRLVGWRARQDPSAWSGIAWPGWASLGMTAGSEYAQVARSRSLRPLEIPEGQEVFLETLSGTPSTPAALLLSEGELRWSGFTLQPIPLGTWSSAPEAHPLVEDHIVGGQITLPGTFGLSLILSGLRERWPGWHLVQAEGLSWQRFVRLRQGAPPLRAVARVLSASPGSRVIEATLVSDFVHADGAVLQKDIVHFRATLHLSNQPAEPLRAPVFPRSATLSRIPDPYVQPGSPVRLAGAFDRIRDIQVEARSQHARYEPLDPDELRALNGAVMPPMLMDTLCRMTTCRPDADGELPVHVPLRCRTLRLAPGLTEAALAALPGAVLLVAARARPFGEGRICDWAAALDEQGQPLMVATGMLARFAGNVVSVPQT